MKRDPDPVEVAADRTLERQLANLAPRLRKQGVAPERDLWPDIAAAIAGSEPRPRRPPTLPLWRIAALAASLLLLLGVGWVQWNGQEAGGLRAAPRAEIPAATAPVIAGETGPGRLDAARDLLDDALERLDEARRNHPESAGLTKLIVMIHESRGDLIRDAAKQLDLPGS